LRGAEAEDLFAQRPQLRRAHFQADNEEEHHDAKFGDVKDVLRVFEQSDAERADCKAGREVAQHRTQSQSPEQRRRNHRRAEQRHRLLKP
jgi:hypothetical protein